MGTVTDIRTRLPVPGFEAIPPKPKVNDKLAESRGAQWYCLRCNTDDSFKLYTDGTVFCGDCNARIDNLTIELKDKGVAKK